MPALDTSSASLSADYRRNARRLRARHGHDLERLHQGLKELSQAADQANVRRSSVSRVKRSASIEMSGDFRSEVMWPHSATSRVVEDLPLDKRAQAFAEIVAQSLSAGLLSYTSRTGLIRLAGTMGIRRFDANLIIALVQQRTGMIPMLESSSIDFDVDVDSQQRSLSPKVMLIMLIAAAIVQGLIVAGVWSITHLGWNV